MLTIKRPHSSLTDGLIGPRIVSKPLVRSHVAAVSNNALATA